MCLRRLQAERDGGQMSDSHLGVELGASTQKKVLSSRRESTKNVTVGMVDERNFHFKVLLKCNTLSKPTLLLTVGKSYTGCKYMYRRNG